jgi:DNA modification methylase
MIPFVQDSDFTLYVGDVRECLRELPDESVHCVVTSPPYWGLRDYGTGLWDGGDPDCDHVSGPARQDQDRETPGGRGGSFRGGDLQYRDICGKCGATRIDRQLGLEATPDEFVAAMVAVFGEVRRVLRADGTCWLNLGDSYASSSTYNTTNTLHTVQGWKQDGDVRPNAGVPAGLKPKDLVGIPWRVAFALQTDGWYLRSDIVWSKPNPMPESVTDRPTKAHEYVFLLTKGPRYFFDNDAVREPHNDKAGDVSRFGALGKNGGYVESERTQLGGVRSTAIAKPGTVREYHPAGRNIRSVWEIATQPYAEAHFATFPEALPERCIKAGCPALVCAECGRPVTPVDSLHGSSTEDMPGVRDDIQQSERVLLLEDVRESGNGSQPTVDQGLCDLGEGLQAVTSTAASDGESGRLRDGASGGYVGSPRPDADEGRGSASPERGQDGQPTREPRGDAQATSRPQAETSEEADRVSALRRGDHHVWSCPSCGCGQTTAGVTLDPFMGSGTVALVARKLGRKSIGIELNPEYAELCARRLQQLSLLAEGTT